jgi:lipopolysaccharide/colanic/teichoic acid biosynthesis glycosyltransferase
MGSFYRRRGKRAFDVVGATGALVVLSPIQLVAAVAVRRRMGSPVLFRQKRPGLGGRPFTLLKFRTMRSPERGEDSVASDSERLTPLGHFLRSSSVDEIPEFWNVLRGDMSLVGPRPLLMEYLDRYTPEQSRRHEVRPGVTGLAQVLGRNDTTWEDRLRLDSTYIDRYSFKLDLKIIFRTITVVLARKGIHNPNLQPLHRLKVAREPNES